MQHTRSRLVPVAVVAVGLVLGACAGGGFAAKPSGEEAAFADAVSEAPATTAGVAGRVTAEAGAEQTTAERAVALAVGYEPRIIREGRVDYRIEPGTFGEKAAAVRALAAEFGGYVAGGEAHVVEIDGERYSVGSVTLRVPEDRFEDLLDRVEGLGERIDMTISSQDVTEEYVDLQSRLRHLRRQEAFYAGLLDRAETIEDLVQVNAHMEQVLSAIEQVEGRLRYLESRTGMSTLTVGLSERPVEPKVAGVPSVGILDNAFDMAGRVLLNTVGFLIVAAAFLLPLAVVATVVAVAVRFVLSRRRRAAEG